MDKAAFKDLLVIRTLSSTYYTVKMDTEALDTISFGSKIYVNQQQEKQRNPKHEIAILLASRNEPKLCIRTSL